MKVIQRPRPITSLLYHVACKPLETLTRSQALHSRLLAPSLYSPFASLLSLSPLSRPLASLPPQLFPHSLSLASLPPSLPLSPSLPPSHCLTKRHSRYISVKKGVILPCL